MLAAQCPARRWQFSLSVLVPPFFIYTQRPHRLELVLDPCVNGEKFDIQHVVTSTAVMGNIEEIACGDSQVSMPVFRSWTWCRFSISEIQPSERPPNPRLSGSERSL